jgi:DNA-binding MarR family transcriptional regulator
MRAPEHHIAAECYALRARRLARVVSRIYDEALRPHGVTAAQMNLLVGIANMEPVAPAKIGQVFDLEKSTLSRNLQGMRRAGWISATKTGRGLELRLLAAGRKKIETIYPDWREAQKKTAQMLGKTTLAGLNAWSPLG